MIELGARTDLARAKAAHGHHRVTYVELFFDLVFVFAITQLSHLLLHDLSLNGLLRTALLLLAVWWVWIDTSWVTNWLDPDKAPVRLMLLALMLVGLVLSTSLPDAFGARGGIFAVAYVTMQVGRSLFVLWALRRHNRVNYRNFQRIIVWAVMAGAFWLAGGFAESETARFGFWAVGLAIESVAPSAGFWVPRLGRSTTADWGDISGGHLGERAGLFIIMALGESVLVIGATFADLEWTPVVIGAVVASFIGSVAMWWLYFNIGADKAIEDIASSSDPGRQARLAYTYIHLLPVAGIIATAVADELVLGHPLGHTTLAVAATLLGGAALYLIGNLLFKWTVYGRPPLSHMVGLALLALLLPTVASLSPLALSAATSAILVIVAIWETLSLRPRRHGATLA
ncbi:MAG TPA: low temperature requirement protein A [Alphaproteobacteria bacterium]